MLKTASATRTLTVATCGLTVALIAVSAWITVPIGPVPFTLQIFMVVFALLALTPTQAIASIGVYLLMGAVGLPVFSGMRGGIGVLAGPTGGFLLGYLVGAVVVLVGRQLLCSRWASAPAAPGRAQGWPLAIDCVCAAVFLLIIYACGWLQFSLVSQTDPLAAFMVAIAPFIVVDAVKIAFAVVVARAVRGISV